MKKFVLLFLMAVSLLSCTEDADNVPCFCGDGIYREYKIEFRGNSSTDSQYPMNIIYFKDDKDGVLTSEIVSSETNTDVIESHTMYSYDKLGFKLSVANSVQAPVDTVIITDLKTNEVIFNNDDLDIPTGKTFMYDVSDHTYTITN